MWHAPLNLLNSMLGKQRTTSTEQTKPVSTREANSGHQSPSNPSVVPAQLTTPTRTSRTSEMASDELLSSFSSSGTLADRADPEPVSASAAPSTSYSLTFENSDRSASYDTNQVHPRVPPPRCAPPRRPANYIGPITRPGQCPLLILPPPPADEIELVFVEVEAEPVHQTMEAKIAATIARLESAPLEPETPQRTLNDEHDDCYVISEPLSNRRGKKKKAKKAAPMITKKECYGLGFCLNFVCDHSKPVVYDPTPREIEAKRALIIALGLALEKADPVLKVSQRIRLYYLITYHDDFVKALNTIKEQAKIRHKELISTGRINFEREVAVINSRSPNVYDKVHNPVLYWDDLLKYIEDDEAALIDVRAHQWGSIYGRRLKAKYRSNFPDEKKKREYAMQLHQAEAEVRENRQAYFEEQKKAGFAGVELDAKMATWDFDNDNTGDLILPKSSAGTAVNLGETYIGPKIFPAQQPEPEDNDDAVSEEVEHEMNTPEWYEENLDIFTEEYIDMHHNDDPPMFTIKPGESKPLIYHPDQMVSLPECLEGWSDDFRTYLRELYMDVQTSDGKTEESSGPPERNLFAFCRLFTALRELKDKDLAVLASQIREDDYMSGYHHTIALFLRGMLCVNLEYEHLIKVPRSVHAAVNALAVRNDLETAAAAAKQGDLTDRRAEMLVHTREQSVYIVPGFAPETLEPMPNPPKRVTYGVTSIYDATGESLTYIQAFKNVEVATEPENMIEVCEWLTIPRSAALLFTKLDRHEMNLEQKVAYLESCIRLTQQFGKKFDKEAMARIITKQNQWDEHRRRIATKDYVVNAVSREGCLIVDFPEKSVLSSTKKNRANVSRGESSKSTTDVVFAPPINPKASQRGDSLWMGLMKDKLNQGIGKPLTAHQTEMLRRQVEAGRQEDSGHGPSTSTLEILAAAAAAAAAREKAAEDSPEEDGQVNILGSFQKRINGGLGPAVQSYFTKEKEDKVMDELVEYMGSFDQLTLACFKECHIEWVGLCGRHPVFTAALIEAKEVLFFLNNASCTPRGGFQILLVCELVAITGNSGARACAFYEIAMAHLMDYCRKAGIVAPTWELYREKITQLCVWMWNRLAIMARAHWPDEKLASTKHVPLVPIAWEEIDHIIRGLVDLGLAYVPS